MLAVCTSLVVASEAAAVGADTQVAGWPILAIDERYPGDPSDIEPMSDGGLVAFNSGVAFAVDAHAKLRWSTLVEDMGCGTWCESWPIPTRRQLDGSFGPFGLPVGGGNDWNVSPAGQLLKACGGPVLADHTCIEHDPTDNGSALPRAEGANLITATRSGKRLWTLAEPYRYPTYVVEEFEEGGNYAHPWPVVGSVDGKTAYVEVPRYQPSDEKGAPVMPARIVAIDTANGKERWSTSASDGRTGGRILERPGGGVIVERADVVLGFNASGTQLWSSPASVVPEGFVVLDRVTPVADGVNRTAYFSTELGSSGPRGISTFRAVDTTNGRVLWSAGDKTRFLSSGKSGVLASRSEGRLNSLIMFGRTGRLLWSQPVGLGVSGARELPDGTIAYSADGVLNRVRPGRAVPSSKGSVGISHKVFTSECVQPHREKCPLPSAKRGYYGTILRFEMPGDAVVKLQLRTPRGKVVWPVHGPDSDATMLVPRGHTYRRLTGRVGLQKAGNYVLRVTSRRLLNGRTTRGAVKVGSQIVRVEFPVTIHFD